MRNGMLLILISISLFLMEMFLAPFLWCIYFSAFSFCKSVFLCWWQRYRYNKIRKAFSKCYHRHSELVVKYSIGLKTLLQQGISEPIFYCDLVYKFKRIVGKPNFSDQFKKIIKHYICADRYLRQKYNTMQTVCFPLMCRHIRKW